MDFCHFFSSSKDFTSGLEQSRDLWEGGGGGDGRGKYGRRRERQIGEKLESGKLETRLLNEEKKIRKCVKNEREGKG